MQVEAMQAKAIRAEVERALRSLGVRRGQKVIAAYSTGPDSPARRSRKR